MNRLALRRLMRRLVAASLPLAAACNSDGLPVAGPPCSPGNNCDMVIVAPPDDLVACGATLRGDMIWSGVVVDGGYPLDGYIPSPACEKICVPPGGALASCHPVEVACGQTLVQCSFPVPGRRPASLVTAEPVGSTGDPLAAFFARAAHLEAASVEAFRILEAELHAHGAPAELETGAARAARDEVRHARVTAKLARRFGAEPPMVRTEASPLRSLAEMARENAIEGCVHETWSALVATHQAAAACDARVRRAMTAIAVDETGHAELAWAVAAWAEPRLDETERSALQAARRAAVARLIEGARVDPPPSLRAVAGLPSGEQAVTMARSLFGTLLCGSARG